MVLSSNLCQEAATANYQDAALIKASSSTSSNGTEASKYNPKNSDSSNTVKKASFGSMKNKFRCAIHGIANHPTEKCNKYKDLLNQNSSANLLPSSAKSPMSFVSVAKKCFRCFENVPWSKEHAARCPRDKPYQGPSKAIRSARLDTLRSNGV
ncbi:hypothetical protein G6F26_013964 [Rhizopus arrhizus]|nr:hypothetical protein G6F26_013964 [Rhizopus arrhizus]